MKIVEVDSSFKMTYIFQNLITYQLSHQFYEMWVKISKYA